MPYDYFDHIRVHCCMLKFCMHVQSAIASTPTAAWQGYLLGGIMWFCIPFTLSTGLGLATVACDLPVSVDEANMVQHPVKLPCRQSCWTFLFMTSNMCAKSCMECGAHGADSQATTFAWNVGLMAMILKHLCS